MKIRSNQRGVVHVDPAGEASKRPRIVDPAAEASKRLKQTHPSSRAPWLSHGPVAPPPPPEG